MTSNSAGNFGFGTAGQVLTSNGASVAPSFQAVPSGSLSLGYATGLYYQMNAPDLSATANSAVSADHLRCWPFIVTETNTFDTFAFNVVTQSSAGTSVRLGIYNSADGLPGTVLVTLGTTLTDVTGVVTVSATQALSAGYYWAAFHAEAAVTITGTSSAKSCLSPIGTTWSGSGGLGLLYSAQAYASGLPNLTGVTPNSYSTISAMVQMRST